MTGKDGDWTEFSVADAAEFYQSLTTSKGHREVVTRYAKETLAQRDLTPEELAWIVDQSTKSPPWIAAAYCAAVWFSNYMPEAQEVDRELPALFVVAESSADIAKTYLATHLPNTRLELLGGHFMFWEHPEEFNAVLETYLEQLE